MSFQPSNGHSGKIMPAHVENKVLGVARRATPDSDALVSSDDDHEQNPAMSMSLQSTRSLPGQRGARRPSWLSEVQQSQSSLQPQRKYSLGGLSLASAGSQPQTPSGENGAYDSNARNFPWNAQVWHPSQPARLNEFMPSPSVASHEDLRSPTNGAHSSTGGLPFDIPLEPNRKTVRSQSYSAGQLENPIGPKRTPMVRRGSRQLLGLDGSNDYDLGSLAEDDDDDGKSSSSGSGQGVPLPWHLSHFGQQDQSSSRGPAISPAANMSNAPGPRRLSATSLLSGTGPETVVPEDVGSAQLARHPGFPRPAAHMGTPVRGGGPVIRSNENQAMRLQRGQWQTSLGFDIPEEGSQSRRHSFAVDIASRGRDPSLGPDGQQAIQGNSADFGFPFNAQVMSLRSPSMQAAQYQQPSGNDDPSYFSGLHTQARQVTDNLDDQPFQVPHVFSRPVRILHIVAFKSNRADIFYIPDNTGPVVQPGDVVIVEGDRGQDLGTVQFSNVTMEDAKIHKEAFTTKHFHTLMMFSRYFPNVAAAASGESTASEGTTANAPASGNAVMTKATVSAADPRPRMIKRLAKQDEVHLLRDKEGNEAKAKRVAQAKVNEHNLRMEILDAEFQHDYKKLTFFFYAEEYINFNDLVTDLFKTFKTRIWMSAINPASFPHPGTKQTPAQQRAAQRGFGEFNSPTGNFEPGPHDLEHDVSIQQASANMAQNMMGAAVPRGNAGLVGLGQNLSPTGGFGLAQNLSPTVGFSGLAGPGAGLGSNGMRNVSSPTIGLSGPAGPGAGLGLNNMRNASANQLNPAAAGFGMPQAEHVMSSQGGLVGYENGGVFGQQLAQNYQQHFPNQRYNQSANSWAQNGYMNQVTVGNNAQQSTRPTRGGYAPRVPQPSAPALSGGLHSPGNTYRGAYGYGGRGGFGGLNQQPPQDNAPPVGQHQIFSDSSLRGSYTFGPTGRYIPEVINKPRVAGLWNSPMTLFKPSSRISH